MHPSDRELMQRVAASDQAAFAHFYDRHSPKVYGVLLRMLRGSTDAEDLLQEVFWQVWTHAPRYDPQRSEPLTWVVMMARSRAMDRLRASGRRRTADIESTEPGSASEVAEDLDRSEAARQARECLAALPKEQKEAIQMAFYDGYTHDEIARRLGQPLGTVKTRIRLGMRKMRELLGPTEAVA